MRKQSARTAAAYERQPRKRTLQQQQQQEQQLYAPEASALLAPRKSELARRRVRFHATRGAIDGSGNDDAEDDESAALSSSSGDLDGRNSSSGNSRGHGEQRSTKKRRRPQSHGTHQHHHDPQQQQRTWDSTATTVADDDAYAERSTHALTDSELSAFADWIARSATEPPAVAGAGAAKRVPDSDLRMFRHSRMPATTLSPSSPSPLSASQSFAKCPPITPVSDSNASEARRALRSPQQQQSHRPQSWEAPSSTRSSNAMASPPRKSVRHSVDALLRDALSTPLASDLRTLPLLTSPSRSVPKDKAAMLELLAECKAKAEGLPAPTASSSTAEQPSAASNQLSGRTLAAPVDPALVIPDACFFRPNSVEPLDHVDLSDWSGLCTEASPLVQQIGDKLSSACAELDLSGLVQLSKPSDFQRLLQRCPHLQRLVLAETAAISRAGFASIARTCPAIEHLSLRDSNDVTDDLLQRILASFSRLTSLDVSGCDRITDAGVRLLCAKRQAPLEAVRLDSCPLVTHASLLQLIKAHGSRLRVLSVRGSRHVSDDVLRALFVSQPKRLQELNVRDCVRLTDASIEYLSTVPSYYGTRSATAYYELTTLDISGCVALTSLACCWIAASCPFLKHLNAARCTGLCDRAAVALASLEHLESLDLSGCVAISGSALERLFLSNGTTLASSATTESAPVKVLATLAIAECPHQSDATVLAIAKSCAATLTMLDLSNVAPLQSPTLVTLVRSCRQLTTLRLRGQRSVTRAVLAHLASCNKRLQVLDLSYCVCVDDLALYPLLVMQSLEELVMTGCPAVTTQGLQSLPTGLMRLALQRCAGVTDDSCRVLADRLRRLEKLDLSRCTGVSSRGVALVLAKCRFAHSVNAFECPQVDAATLSRVVQALPPNAYALDVVDDPDAAFRGISAVDVQAAEKTRRRERALAEQARLHDAAQTIQLRYTATCRYRESVRAREDREWRAFCAAVDIQRVARGYLCRKTYVFVRSRVTKAIVYLQYRWRQRREQRRVRRAAAFWTNRALLKTFRLWKQCFRDAQLERAQAKAALLASKALRFWGEKTLARIVAAWRAYVRERVVKAKRALGFWKCQSLPRVLAAWRSYTMSERARRQRLTHVFLNAVELETHNSARQLEQAGRANALVKRLIWRLWREFVVDQKRFLLKATLSIVCGSLSAWAFRQWHQNARYRRQCRDKTRLMLLKLVHREKASVWTAWREFVHRRRANKRALLRFSSSIQVKCWLKWKQHHDEIAHLKRVGARVAARFRLLGAGKAVATWYDFAQDAIAAKHRMRRALAYFTNASRVRTFAAWADYTAYMKAFRLRTRARMENASLAYALTSWVTFTRMRREVHATATALQAFWRGVHARRCVEDAYYRRIWAAVLIQTAWRGRLGRLLMRAATRQARLREYLRAERERDRMDAEERGMRQYTHAIDMVVLLQRQWRGVAARQLFIEVRRARYILKKQQEAEMQEIIRAQARQRALDRIQLEKTRQLAAIEIQRHIRGYLGRKWYRSQQDLIHQQRAARRVQAVYRGRMSRRRTSALRRSYITRMEILARRAVEGTLLRTLGAKTRSTQRGLRGFLAYFGLDPATFLTDIRVVMKEVREDFHSLKQFFDVVKTKVHANAKAKATASAATTPLLSAGGPAAPSTAALATKAAKLVQKRDAAKQFLRDLETIVDTTAAEKETQVQAIVPGMAVRIVLRGHHRCGETAFVLGVKDGIAEVKMDVDSALEFVPLQVPATKVEPAKYVLHQVPELAFTAAYTNTVNGKISSRWRQQLEDYAASIADESKRYCAARVIQCAARVYLARMQYQRELEAQGVHAARRQQALLRVLQTFGCANTRIAAMLLQLRFVRALNLPPGLPDEPLGVQKVLDRVQRWRGRRTEVHQAFLHLVPEVFQGDGPFHGHMMPAPYTRLLDKLLHYPLRWLQRTTCVPVAQQLEKRGLAELASFIGGAEFVKTFEERHTDAREHFFPQLQRCSYCASEGWALVHGVFETRKVPVDFPSLRNSSRKKAFVTKRVPHGWGVAHFLTGAVGSGAKRINWLARNSIEAQFKSLTLVKAMKQQEREERLATQILARQGTLNTLRSAEGARGYAKRHAELSLLEAKTVVFYKRLNDEHALRAREEAAIFADEQRLNALVADERCELARQGRHLHELQQQVPEVVVDVDMVASSKTALELLVPGCVIDVLYDDDVWYACEVVRIDPFDTCTAEIVYVDDQRRETIKLLETSVLEAKQFQLAEAAGDAAPKPPPPRTVSEITAAAAAKARADEIPFRPWRAGSAVDISWTPPFDNGAAITQYVLEWRDDTDESVCGTKEISAIANERDRALAGSSSESASAGGSTANPADEADADAADAPLPLTKTTLWPIPPERAQTLRVRIAAVNKKGAGLASVFAALPDELAVVSFETAEPLVRPPVDTTALERREQHDLAHEDDRSAEHRRRLTCSICSASQASEADVHDHIARTHAVPLLCPFKSCRQVCASEPALRYHIWRCSVPTPTPEEQQSELFMEIFNISPQYCLRKPRRHVLPPKSALLLDADGDATNDPQTVEEMYLERKYDDACVEWHAKAREIHERNLVASATARRRERENRYDPPRELYGVDFASAELNVARRNAVLATIATLEADLAAFVLETNTQMDALKHEEKELLDYIALKVKRMKTSEEEWQRQSLQREKKKAAKSLTVVQDKIAVLTTTSTQRIDAMTAEIERLRTIEKAFVPFTHQVVKTQRLGTLVRETHAKTNGILATHRMILDHFQDDLRKLLRRADREVEGLEAWDAMIAARRKQLEMLQDELRRLQLCHLAELASYMQQRDDGDERFELQKLREQQVRIITRQERAAQALLASTKQTNAQAAAAKAASASAGDGDGSFELTTSIKSLAIVNHDLALHEKFIKGKAEDAEYLRDESAKAPAGAAAVGGGGEGANSRLVDTVKGEEGTKTAAAQQQAGEQSSESAADALADTDASASAAASPRRSTAKRARKTLHELPHTYTRLECSFQDGFIRGHVRIEYNDGSVYEGPWVEDVHYNKPTSDLESTKTHHAPAHWGKFTYRDGTVWEGDDVDNFFSPFTATGESFHVTTPMRSGDASAMTKYIGAVRMGKYHGFGTLHMHYTFSKGEYTGEWCDGKRQGYGIEHFDVGEVYEGYWSHDVYHGDGEIVYDDASRYEGAFRFGKWHGDGVRTLASGDRILGHFTDGVLNGAGIMEFADKRHYHGAFKNTRRHGMGVLTFPNGDRYEGPFEDDQPHGEGRFVTKTSGTAEPLVRLGQWVRGERTAWLSRPSSELATKTFIESFAVLANVTGEVEMTLVRPAFTSPYAVMVASMLPTLPEGVNCDDAFVQTIVRMLAKTQNVMVGTGILDKTVAEHTAVQRELDDALVAFEALRNTVDDAERALRAQTRKVNDQQDELDAMTAKELEMQVKLESFWKRDAATQSLERTYKRAVDTLHDVDIMDWYKLRTAKLDAVYLSLLEAFAVLLNFTENAYLNDKPYVPTRDDLTMLLSSSHENVFFGDKEGLIHHYDVKALYVLPLFDVYSFSDGVRRTMLQSIAHVIHHPRLRPNNVRLSQISPAATAVCAWVRAAYFYATKANEVAPIMHRVLAQLRVLERLRDALASEQRVLADERLHTESVRRALADQRAVVDGLRTRVQELERVITGIQDLDRNEHVPIEKEHVKRPQTFRPPSASVSSSAAGHASGDASESDTTQEAAPSAAAPLPTQVAVNHRQVFEETHDEHAREKDAARRPKERVLEQILTNPDLAQDFAVLKREVHKVIDRCDGKVALHAFPAAFERVMLKTLDPSVYGVKKLRTLLALMDDTCVIVEPASEGEVETVQFPVDPDEVGGLALLPRLACVCRTCPGVSYASRQELAIHETTKWHYWNRQRKDAGEAPVKWTLASTFWSEAYDSVDNAICYFNRMTGEVVKSTEPPAEMQANDVLLELLEDAPVASVAEDGTAHVVAEDGVLASLQDPPTGEVALETADPWEEVADDAGNVYFYNQSTGESSWVRPVLHASRDES